MQDTKFRFKALHMKTSLAGKIDRQKRDRKDTAVEFQSSNNRTETQKYHSVVHCVFMQHMYMYTTFI